MQEQNSYTPETTAVNAGQAPADAAAPLTLTDEDMLAMEAKHYNAISNVVLEHHINHAQHIADTCDKPLCAHDHRTLCTLLTELQQRRQDMAHLLAHVRAMESAS